MFRGVRDGVCVGAGMRGYTWIWGKAALVRWPGLVVLLLFVHVCEFLGEELVE